VGGKGLWCDSPVGLDPEKVKGNGQYLTVQFKDAVLNMRRWDKWRVVGQKTGV